MPSQFLPEGPIGDVLSVYFTYFSIMFVVCFIPTAIAWWRLHDKVGMPGWSGVVPFYNLIVLAQSTGASLIPAILMMFTPTAAIGSLFVFPIVARSFSNTPQWVAYVSVLFPPLIFWWVGFGKNVSFEGAAGGRAGKYPIDLRPRVT